MRLAARCFVPVALLIALAGCTLVDQRTFRAAAPEPGAAELGPAGAGAGAGAGAAARPLAVIRMGEAGPDYRPMLAEAVQAAQQRNPDARFDVIALVPTRASPAEQDRRIAEAARDAQEVATAMGAAGVPSDWLTLGLRGDPGVPAREVRVHLR